MPATRRAGTRATSPHAFVASLAWLGGMHAASPGSTPAGIGSAAPENGSVGYTALRHSVA